MFNDDAFSKIKKGARIVNVARGGVIDDAALGRALDAGQVAQVRVCPQHIPVPILWQAACSVAKSWQPPAAGVVSLGQPPAAAAANPAPDRAGLSRHGTS